MWKNVTIGVMSVTLIFVFALYWAAAKAAKATAEENARIAALPGVAPVLAANPAPATR